MSKITKKGIIKKVSTIEKIGVDGTEKQTAILYVPARTNEFNEVVGQADMFELTVIGKKVKEINLNAQMVERKAEVEFWLNGRQFDRQDNTKGYAHNLTIAKITLLDDKAQTVNKSVNEVPENF